MFYISMINNVNHNQQSFHARNNEIKKVDKICRQVMLMFPVISPTKLDSFKNHSHFLDYIYKKDNMLSQIRNKQWQALNIKEFFDIPLGLMKKEKVGNCGELSLATLINLKLNGYKNCYLADLYAYNKKTQKYREIDHQTVVILSNPFSQMNFGECKSLGRFGRKSIIVDSFIGKADYYFNMKQEYVKNNLFEDGLGENEVLACEIENLNICEEDLKVFEEEYSLEYGTNKLAIHADSIKKGDKVVIVDDLLATGGTVKAGIDLVNQLGGEVVGTAFLIELTALHGKDDLPCAVKSLIEY